MNVIEVVQKQMKNYPRRTVNFFLFCLAGALLFVFGGVVPAYLNHVYLEEKISDARRRIGENDALQPIFRSMQSARGSVSTTLTIPSKTALKRSEIERVDASFRGIAGQSGMKVVSIVPELGSAGDARVLAENLSLKGEYEHFRTVLKKLGELPYLDRVDEFSIRRAGNSRSLDITMKVLIAVN